MTASTLTASASLPNVPAAVAVVPQAPPGPPVCVSGVHPAAALFPLMHGSELDLLVADIAQNGLREPIVLCGTLILDGRNRMHACELAKVQPRFVEWDGDGSPLAFVLSRNLHRRHLDESQRAIIAARAKGMFKKEAAERERATRFGSRTLTRSPEGRDGQKSRVSPGGANLHRPQRSNSQAGTMLNISARLVAVASRVLAAGDEQLIAAIEAGLITVSDAAAILDLPKDKQCEAVALVASGQARTLRQAVEPGFSSRLREKSGSSTSEPGTLTSSATHGVTPPRAASDGEKPTVSLRQLRRACQRFTTGHEKLCREIESAAEACGGPNDHTRRAREGLFVALRAMQSCLLEFSRRERPK